MSVLPSPSKSFFGTTDWAAGVDPVVKLQE